MIPKLERHCGSWIITRKGDATVIGEFFDRRTVERFNPDACLIETTAQYLGRINSHHRALRGASVQYGAGRVNMTAHASPHVAGLN